jgi:TolB-like protein/DNA-binding winged helix-turn-helix (wHTH) protein/Flp pilus assembly protein TadD
VCENAGSAPAIDHAGWKHGMLKGSDLPLGIHSSAARPDAASRLRFGVFEVDLHSRELRKLGKRLPLQDQPFQVLALLLAQPGSLVTREELQKRLWPHTVVDFDHGLNKAVAKIRDALGDSADSPRFVQTVARRGYRFLADVTAVGDATGVTGAAVATTRSRRFTAWTATGLSIALLLVAALIYRAVLPHSSAPRISSLLVLPLENLSGDVTQDYFADGMTDELITELAHIGSLRVISRSSAMTYKHVQKPLAQIARELDVQAVVEGTVFRSGDRVRLSARLIRVPTDEHLWAQSYEGDIRESLELQSRVAQTVARRIKATLSLEEHAALSKSRVVDPQGYEAYLKGRYYWNKRTPESLTRAMDYFRVAIEADPADARAYAGLADSYALAGDWESGRLPPQEAFTQAQMAAKQALALDDDLSEAHTSLAFALDAYAWDWDAAEREYQRALELDPNYATAHHWHGWHLLVNGHDDAGILELRRAAKLDPLSLIINADIADALCIAHRYDESIRQSRQTLELDPGFALAHFELGQALEQKQQHPAAVSEFQKAIEISGHRSIFDSNLAHAYAVSGHAQQALDIVHELEMRHDQAPAVAANVAMVYAGLGDRDEAMRWLQKAYLARFNPSILLRPAFDGIRADPRFQELWRRIITGSAAAGERGID